MMPSQPASGLLPLFGGVAPVPRMAQMCPRRRCLLKDCFPRLPSPLQCHCLMCLAEAPLLGAQEATLLAAGVPGWEAAPWVLAACPQKGTAPVVATAVAPVGPQVQAALCHGRAAALGWWPEVRLVPELATVAAVVAPGAAAAEARSRAAR